MSDKKKLGQGPAYPCDNNSEDTYIKKDDLGMTKYELIAKDAMCAILSKPNNNELNKELVCKTAINYAGELLKQLEN